MFKRKAQTSKTGNKILSMYPILTASTVHGTLKTETNNKSMGHVAIGSKNYSLEGTELDNKAL